jgi:hypothetical protein
MLAALSHEYAPIIATMNGEHVPEGEHDTRPAASVAVREAIH